MSDVDVESNNAVAASASKNSGNSKNKSHPIFSSLKRKALVTASRSLNGGSRWKMSPAAASASATAISKRRRPNWNEDETNLLIDLMKENKSVLLKKFKDRDINNDTKQEVWQSIANKINCLPYQDVKRSVKEVQDKWYTMQSRAVTAWDNYVIARRHAESNGLFNTCTRPNATYIRVVAEILELEYPHMSGYRIITERGAQRVPGAAAMRSMTDSPPSPIMVISADDFTDGDSKNGIVLLQNGDDDEEETFQNDLYGLSPDATAFRDEESSHQSMPEDDALRQRFAFNQHTAAENSAMIDDDHHQNSGSSSLLRFSANNNSGGHFSSYLEELQAKKLQAEIECIEFEKERLKSEKERSEMECEKLTLERAKLLLETQKLRLEIQLLKQKYKMPGFNNNNSSSSSVPGGRFALNCNGLLNSALLQKRRAPSGNTLKK